MLVSEDIFPIGEFKRHASSLLSRVNEEKRPILITQNGSPISVIIPPEEYDRLLETNRFMAAVTEGLRQSEAGRVLSEKDLDKELDRDFGPEKKAPSR